MTLPSGTRLGAFEILAPLGAGGMGEVYRARDVRLDREVAVKVLPAEFATDPARLKRFEKEARGASALNHPAIVTIYEVGAEGSAPFIAMELVAGKTLREVLLDGPLSSKRLLAIASQVAEGLAAAHDAGIVHRDLKPENVMVAAGGTVKILDFGLAKLTRKSLDTGEGGQPTMSRTEPGGLLGTVTYMSPEQAAGLPTDFRSDQFSLGSVLYEMATGKRAFQRENAVDTLSAILHEEPEAIPMVAPQVPLPLEWVVGRCLAKDPAERYASTKDLAWDLRTIRDHVSLLDISRSRLELPYRSRAKRWLAAALLAVGVLAVAFLSFQTGRKTDPARSVLESVSSRRVTFRRGNITNSRFAPDGETIVYSAAWEGQPQEIYVTSSRGVESRPLGIAKAQLLSVSNSGELAILLKKDNLVSKTGRGTLARAPLAGGAPRELMEDADWEVDWGRSGELAVVREANGKTRIEYPIGKAVYVTTATVHCPRVSPDGNLIAFFDASGGAWVLAIVDREGKKTVLLRMDGFSGLGDLAWHPSRKEVWFNATQNELGDGLFAVDLSGKVRTVSRPLSSGFVLTDISRDGKVLFERETYRLELLYRGAGDETERDLSWFEQSQLNDISRDGKLLLFTELQRDKGAVYVRRTDGSPAIRLADGLALAISPDGRSVLVAVPNPGLASFQLLRVPIGPGLPQPIPVGALTVNDAAWLPDGKRIFLSATEPGQIQRGYVIELPNGKPRPFGEGRLGGFSPDGRFATMGGFGEKWQILPVEGGKPQPIPGIEAGEVVGPYTSSGREINVVRFGGIPVRITRVDVATGKRTLWKELAPADRSGVIGVNQVVIGADDKTYAYNIERVVADDLYVVEGLK